jgi:amino acid adenylation domain-containing protein
MSTGTVDLAEAPELLPITESQKGLLVVDSLVPTREIYNQIMQFDLDPARCAAPLTEAAVTDVLIGLVTVQPALRQVFSLMPEMQGRLLPAPAPADYPIESAEADPVGYEAALAEMARRIGTPPFDLTVGPVYRWGFVRSTDGAAAAVILSAHHIVGDGVSIGPIVRDLQELLTGELAGEAIETKRAERETAFAKELRAQNRVATSERTAQRTAEWAERLREVPPLVLYPRPDRPTRTDFAGARLAWTLDEADTELFAATCKRLAITPFVLLTAVYGAVLARHSGQAAVLVGSPFAARRTIGAFDLCGFFTNTLPVTVEVDWARTVDEQLSETVRTAVDFCRSHVDVTFNQLVAQAQPDRPSDRNPLFSAMLAMQDTFDGASAGAVVGVREPGNGTAKFDLWLGATPIDGRWLLELEYDRALIPVAVAEGLLGSLRTALRRAVEDGSRTLADLFADDATPAVDDGVPVHVPFGTLSEWFEDTARRTPDAVAVEDPAGSLTYARLAAAAERIAGGLAAQGVGPGDVVGLHLDSLGESIPAILATLRRGAAYLPLDATLPAERLAYMVERAGCRVILGKGLDLPGAPAVPLEELAGEAPSAASPDSPVYVMYTSGSTGRPKGVLMSHPPLLNLAAWQVAALEMSGDSRFLQYAPAGFDVSYQEIMPTLLAGGTVVSREPADRRDFPALLRRIAETRVTHVYLPVAALRPFVQTVATAENAELPDLRYLCVSGEQLLVDSEIRAFFAAHPGCVLVNHYGPTETQGVTSQRLSAADADWPRHVPIGLPLPNVACYVVDATGHLAPAGVPGEMYLGGCSPAHGYVNDADRTAAGFVPDRFAGHGTMYRTGDQVVRDEYGRYVYLGRDDSQVKIRGYRVELGEIEAVATGVAGVSAAVAVARTEGDLVLFLIGTADHDEVRQALTRALPAYMVPAWILDLDRVPTSTAGKTDRGALLRLAGERIAERRGEEVAAPARYDSPLEEELAGIWAEVLKVDAVERDRPVLEYGAHSLSIFTALAQVQAKYGVTLQVVDFFRSPTVATLAEMVRAAA